jgi:ribose/xylose/arabinose/galactoside ABC-type transport system permease subunit
MMRALLIQVRPSSTSLRAVALAVALAAALTAASGSFSSRLVLDNVRQAAPLGVIALGQALILMTGRLDLSVGATASVANIVLSSIFANDPDRVWAALLATATIGAAIGAANGLLVTLLRIPAFLATLAMSLVLSGGMLLYTGGSPRGGVPSGFRVITEGWIGPMPISAIIWLAVAASVFALAHLTLLGRKMLLAGSNPLAARHLGVPVEALSVLTFVLSALLATLGGVMLSAITGMASIGVGDSATLDSIAAIVIGGAAFSGGVMLPLGAIAGTLILFLLQSLLYLLSLPVGVRFVLQGGIIVLALALANFRKAR